MNNSSVNPLAIQPQESPRLMEELKQRDNTMVKFFKYKEIKQKYKKGKRAETLPSKLMQSSDPGTGKLKYRIDQEIVKMLKDQEKNIMSYGLFMPHYEQNSGRSGRASLLKKGLIQSNRDFSNYLQIPAPYMENERTKLKKNNKKNDTLGNVNKPPCDFTADLNILSHQTAFMKAA